MDANTYHVSGSFSLERNGARRSGLLLLLSLLILLLLLALLAGGRDRDLLPTPLPTVVREPATCAELLLHPGVHQVTRYAPQRLILLLLGKPWSAVSSRGCGGGLGLLRDRCLLFTRIVGLSGPTLALSSLALGPRVLLPNRMSRKFFLLQELFSSKANLLNGRDQLIVLRRYSPFAGSELLAQPLRKATLQELLPGRTPAADLLVQRLHPIDVLEHAASILLSEEFLRVGLLLEVDLVPVVHSGDEGGEGVPFSVLQEAVGPSVEPIPGLSFEERSDDPDQVLVVVPGSTIVMKVIIHCFVLSLVGGVGVNRSCECIGLMV